MDKKLFKVKKGHEKAINNPQGLLLLTPPFTQLNSPYPATAYLNTLGIESCQADLGIEVILRLFR